MKRAILYLAIVYLLLLVAIWAFIYFDGGSNWLVTLFLFSPRWVVALPLVLLVPLTLAFRFRLTWVYLLHIAVIVWPILGFQLSLSKSEASQNRGALRLMSCNLGGGEIRTDKIISLVRSHEIQVLMLQECPSSISIPLFEELGWTHRQEGNMAVGSSFDLGQLQILARQPESHYRAVAAVSCELRLSTEDKREADSESIQLVCVHLPTFRPALQKAIHLDRQIGSAIRSMAFQYRNVADQLHGEVQSLEEHPIIVAGDFNVPVESAYYREYWGDYRNALNVARTGLGYTKYTRYHGVRIDHILVDNNWSVARASVGPGVGGDHRPVIVELIRLGESPSTDER